MSLCVGEPSSMQHAVFDFPRRTCPFVSTHLLFSVSVSVLFLFLLYLFLVPVLSLFLHPGLPWRPVRCSSVSADSRRLAPWPPSIDRATAIGNFNMTTAL